MVDETTTDPHRGGQSEGSPRDQLSEAQQTQEASSVIRTAEEQAKKMLAEAERQIAEMRSASETLMKEAHLFRAEARQALEDARNHARVMQERAQAAQTEAQKTLDEARETNIQARSMYENAVELRKRAEADVERRFAAVEQEAESIRATAVTDAERIRAAAAAEARELTNETRADVNATAEEARAEAQQVKDAAHRDAEIIIEKAHQLALAVRRDAMRESAARPPDGGADEDTRRWHVPATEGHGATGGESDPVVEFSTKVATPSRRRRRKEKKARSNQPSPIDLRDHPTEPANEGEAAEPDPAKRGLLRRRR